MILSKDLEIVNQNFHYRENMELHLELEDNEVNNFHRKIAQNVKNLD